MTFKSKNSLGGAVALLVFILSSSALNAHLPIPPKKGEIGRRETNVAAPSFSLTDQSGKRFSFVPASGEIVLVTFVYTTCPDVCPLFSAHFAAIQRALDDEKRSDYWLLSISTDPKRDTPAKLKSYAEAFKANLQRWRFLTGSAKDLAKVWKQFGVNVKDHGDGQIQHTNLTTLIDAKGRRRVDYYGDKWLVKEVLKDIKWLESKPS
jgi:protein SCO1/2